MIASKKSTEIMVDIVCNARLISYRALTFAADVTSTLTTLIIDGISSHSILLDSYVVLYAAFVSSLHKIVGVEFGGDIYVGR